MPFAPAPSSSSASSAIRRRTPARAIVSRADHPPAPAAALASAFKDIRFTCLRWLVYLATGVCILNWLLLPAALNVDRAEAMSASVQLERMNRSHAMQLLIRGRDTVSVECVHAPTVCAAPRIRRSDPWEVSIQRIGLFRSAWLLEATRDGQPIVDLAEQSRVYQRHKTLLGWLSLFAAALSALLVWAGPFRSPDRDEDDRWTLWP